MKEKQHINSYDLLIIGGGINGAMLYRVATDSAKKVLLLEKKDFASGTSQASGMMIWGGILYLQNLEFNLVRKFCKARDQLIKHSNKVYTRRFHYTFLKNSERSALVMRIGLTFYRFLSKFKRASTKSIPNTQLPSNWNTSLFKGGLSYEEGFLKESDAQFTMDWIFRTNTTASKAYNYSEIQTLQWLEDKKLFKIQFNSNQHLTTTVFAASVVNACGIWADTLNSKFNIKTKASHHLSKGVYLLLDNQIGHKDAFVLDTEENKDVICWVPWGNTIMWGPTETNINSVAELPVTKDDVAFLLDKLNSKLNTTITSKDIINVRTGIRPLLKENGEEIKNSLDLSRKAILESDKQFPWHTIFGGKLSGGLEFSKSVYARIFKEQPSPIVYNSGIDQPTTTAFFDAMELPDVAWTVKHTQVRCLEDYLRRRTNIAQWIPLGGLGFNNEYLQDIMKISQIIHDAKAAAALDFKNYIDQQKKERNTWEN